jgi:hypothetical protein
LKDSLLDDELSTFPKVDQLRKELAEYHQNYRFLNCDTMARILLLHMKEFILLDKKQH